MRTINNRQFQDTRYDASREGFGGLFSSMFSIRKNKDVPFIFRLVPFFIVGIALLVVGGIIFTTVTTLTTRNTYENCVVNSLSTFATEDGVQKRVYTENCGEFTVNDNILTGTLHSGSIYGSLKEGEAYNFTATGIRLHFPTLFPNIVEVTPAQQ